ncbi:MAG: hypothetical protein Kow00127_07870 [Bacteroidales bacterium]
MKRQMITLLIFGGIIMLFSGAPVLGQYSLDFNGGSDYAELSGVDFEPPWSLEVMVNKNLTDNYQHLLTSDDGNSGVRIEQWWGTKVGFTQSGVADWYFNYVLPVGEWVSLAITCDGSVTKLYVDGAFNSSVNAAIDFPQKWISKPNDEASLNAKIDELRIWNAELTPELIQQYAGQPVGPEHPMYENLVHYYKFDEGSGNIAHDETGNFDAIIHGANYYIDTDHDAGVVELVAPALSPDNYGPEEELIVEVRNWGFQPIEEDFEVSYQLEGVWQETVIVPAGSNPIPPNQSVEVSFSPVDLNTSGSYHFTFYTNLPGDENPANDTLTKTLVSMSNVVGNITSVSLDTNTVEITCTPAKVRVIFYTPEMFRIWLAPNGYFSNPAGNHIVQDYSFPLIPVTLNDEGNYYSISSGTLTLRAWKNPLRFALYTSDGETLIWEESSGLDFGTRTFQYLTEQPDEYFYGGGMQNGYFSHKGSLIKISKEIQNWDDGAVPNPVPFYMSTRGYGAFRNTFAPGEYDFREAPALSHFENRFDCFYFYGPSLKDILNRYTMLTGRPLMPPRWGLELGDADCYNDNGQTTPVVIEEVAQKYRDYDLPGGWILPNDGYGCGYTNLPYVVEQLHQLGFYTGLWTEDGVSQIAWEVGVAGTRLCKLDVAWVGAGYLNALNACRQAYEGIEDNCDSRGYVWSVCGWAGTQRYSVVWSGDQAGSFENIRFHIPTIIGAGLSGYSLASSDVDGIFGGSATTYARDLQWKAFIPVTYTMSGWAPNDKHPWNYGATVMNIARDYLKLKMRLTPYMYTLVHEAHETGVPPVRAMVLEFPDDPVTLDATTQYQFMLGPSMLVAPVYSATVFRDSIWFPEGTWIDYWYGGWWEGGTFVNNYPAPLEKCPLFIRSGAIIPMYPEMLYDEQLPKDPVTFDIYPDGTSSFTMYEDDGKTREYQQGAYALSEISCTAPGWMQFGTITVEVGASIGSWQGKPEQRGYRFILHTLPPAGQQSVLLNGSPLQGVATPEELDSIPEGFCYVFDNGGKLLVKTEPMPLAETFTLQVDVASNSNTYPVDTGKVLIYPNPAKDQLNIRLREGIITGVELVSLDGSSVYQSPASVSSPEVVIPLDVPDGIYIARITTRKGHFSRKITVAR